LPLACGLAIAECLDPSGLQAQLKWPNDVLIDDRKLAGVLIELDTSRRPWGAAIGIGLNWHLPASERRRIDRAATDLHELLGAALPDRQQLLGELVLRLLGVIDDLRRGQGAELLRRWRARDALCNSEVELVNGDQRCCGVARSVDGSGRLQLQTAAGIQFWSAGEVERVLRSAACAAAG
jgi:BirA family biotin operon repressor/biotin-[acetyl-CoA-carboxylase] ligase